MSFPRPVITVSKIKLDGMISVHRMAPVHTDADGLWLYSPEGTIVTRSDGSTLRQPADGVQCFPTAGWFAAWCWAPSTNPPSEYWTRPWISVDLADPIKVDLAAGTVSFVDLELDVWCSDEGAGIVDQDELADAEQRGLLTVDQAATARRTGEDLHQHLSAGRDQAFGGVGWRLLDQARSLNGPDTPGR